MRSLILTVSGLALCLFLVACAHQNQAAPNAPNVSKAQPAPAPAPTPAPKAKVPPPQQPRQYQGPPPAAKIRPQPQPTLELVGQAGWRVVGLTAQSLTLMHTKAKGVIIFKLLPTLQVGPPSGMCQALRQVGKRNKMRPSKLWVTKNKMSCSFNWSQTLKQKGVKIKRWRGKVSVDMRRDLPTYTLLMIGQWPAKHHKLMLKHFNAYRRTAKVKMSAPSQPRPEKKLDRLK